MRALLATLALLASIVGAGAQNAGPSDVPPYALFSSTNTWQQTQTFSAMPIFSACSGLIQANGSSVSSCLTSIALTSLSPVAADTLVGNITGATAVPAAYALSNCSNGMTYSTSTHGFGCLATAPAAAPTYVAISGTTTLTSGQSSAFVKTTGSSTYTVTLPTAANALYYTIYNANTSAVTISAGGSTASGSGLSGASTFTLPSGASVEVFSDGANWLVSLSSYASSADVQAGTDATKAVTPAALSGSQAFQTLTFGATTSWNMQSGYNAKLTLTGNVTTFNISNPVVGQTYTLLVIQDASGNRTVAWPGSFDWGSAGTPTLSTAANKVDMVSVICTASTPTFYAVANKGF